MKRTPAAPADAVEPTPAVLAIVGAGPRGTGLLERIAANAPELWDGRPLHIHLVDPHLPGPGRVWRHQQSPLLRMNSMAEDVTLFTDESSTMEGPVRPGPSLAEWAAQFTGDGVAAIGAPHGNGAVDGNGAPGGNGAAGGNVAANGNGHTRASGNGTAPRRYEPYAEPEDPEVLAELCDLRPTDFPTRRVQGAYLDWALRRALNDLPPQITVRMHRATATSVTGPADGPQQVHLAGRSAPLTADAVVLAQGHLGADPGPEHRPLADFARRHGRCYLPPEFSADADLTRIRPGEHVILRGFGLAFVDLTVLLTEGRGGGYRTEPDGTLIYLPSGREPVIHVGSRRGVPYHSKTGYRLQGPPAPFPRYFGPETIDAVLDRDGPLDLRRDLWPLMAKEIGFGYYHELFHAHPERTARPWKDFLAAYDRLDWYSPQLSALVSTAVPALADRLDFEALDRPLAGLTFPSAEAFQEHLRGYIAHDADRRADPAHSADLGAFLALLSVYGQLSRIAASGRLTAHSLAHHLDGWWHGFFSFLASGPPGFRLRELLALSRAGVVRFLGADLRVEPDERTGTYLATSSTVPGHTVTATTLIEARLPRPSLARTQDPLLRALNRSGELTEEVISDSTLCHRSGLLAVAPEDGRVLDPAVGGPHPRRIALGVHTSGRAVAAFARPRTNAPAFRQNDVVARALLRTLSEQSKAPSSKACFIAGT